MKDKQNLAVILFIAIVFTIFMFLSSAHAQSFISCKTTANGKILCVDTKTGEVFIMNPQRT